RPKTARRIVDDRPAPRTPARAPRDRLPLRRAAPVLVAPTADSARARPPPRRGGGGARPPRGRARRPARGEIVERCGEMIDEDAPAARIAAERIERLRREAAELIVERDVGRRGRGQRSRVGTGIEPYDPDAQLLTMAEEP